MGQCHSSDWPKTTIMKHPRVSIITVNYKQPTVTCELLDSIASLRYPNLETIIVDNGQTYDDSPLYRIHLPNVKVLNVEENVGFAKGNNIGIRAATGDYLFLLNNDTEISDGVIEGLISVFKEELVGAVSPVLRYYSNDEIQYAGFTEINAFTGRNSLIQVISEDQLTDTPYIHGAALMIPKSVIQECGEMPEDYFLYYEELDWSRIIRGKGYSLKVLHSVSVLHKESTSTGKNSPLKVYYQTRNRIHFMRKVNGNQWIIFLCYFLLISSPKNLITHLFLGRMKHFSAFYKAFFHGLISRKTGFQSF